jgi:hypothetical protein
MNFSKKCWCYLSVGIYRCYELFKFMPSFLFLSISCVLDLSVFFLDPGSFHLSNCYPGACFALLLLIRRIFGLKREKVAGGRRRLQNEELHNLYASPNLIRVIKARRVRWVWHVARMGERWEIHTRFWLENLKGRSHPEDLDVDGRIIWEGILRK